MPENEIPSNQIPETRAVVRKKTRLSIVWIVPIVAAVIGVWVAVATILNQGPKITILFRTAEGIEAGKTKIRYNGVDIGTIRAVRLTNDHRRVIATAEMAPNTEAFLVEDTKFWAVTPRVSGANVTGLGTLISGAYIGLDIGKSSKKQDEFTALDAPPVVKGDVPGRFFVLKTADLGSVDYGTPIYFRRLNVGQVVSYELDKDGRTLTVKVFVKAPYDQYVTPETRFWQASGIDVSLSAKGIAVETQSVLSMLVGGLAFETPATGPSLPPAEPNTQFTLYANRTEAYRPPPQNPHTYVLAFNQSVRGLEAGAPVEFRGIPMGQVEDIESEFDEKRSEFTILVTVSVDAQRLGLKVFGVSPSAAKNAALYREAIDRLVAHGFRAQLQTGSLVTGSMFVALDFFRDAPPTKIDWTQNPPRLATVPGKFEGIDASIASILKKLDQVPYEEIGNDVRKTLANVDQTLANINKSLGGVDQVLSGVDRTLGGVNQTLVGVDQDLPNALREVGGAARSLRLLTDYLEQHPEALIKGKSPAKGE
jgi:paraquat-inducible protein B